MTNFNTVMKRHFVLLSLSFFIYFMSFGWGQKGHDIVAYIDQQHLTPTAKEAVDSILDGYSMVYWANWLDNASHTPEYEYTKTWHYKNIDAGSTFEKAPKIKEGNIVDAIYDQTRILQDPLLDYKGKQLAIKMIIHFVGDIHQPLHLGHASDKGGNYWKLRFFKSPTNLHSIWDTNLVESAHAWSHSEWQQEIDILSKQDEQNLVKNGNPDTWGKETFEICRKIYENTPQEYNVSYDYIADWTPVVEEQLLKGGLRLADLLNSVFDPNYIPLNSFVIRK